MRSRLFSGDNQLKRQSSHVAEALKIIRQRQPIEIASPMWWSPSRSPIPGNQLRRKRSYVVETTNLATKFHIANATKILFS